MADPSQVSTAGKSIIDFVSAASSAAELNDFVNYSDPFWFYATSINGTFWNEQHPYALQIVKREADGRYTGQELFILPIPPQELSIQTPFAINTQVTLGGIVEQHNAAPIRIISCTGTTGIMPLRPSASILTSMDLSRGVLAGSLNNVGKTLNQIKNSAQDAVGAINAVASGDNDGASVNQNANVVSGSEFTDGGDLAKTTGYYQFRLLRQFLEGYVTLKKAKAGANLRLALIIEKDEEVYLVTPASFDLRRTASSPWEYNYSLNFKAWKRIKFMNGSTSFVPFVNQIDSSITSGFGSLQAAVASARDALLGVQSLQAVMAAAIGDITANVLEPMRSLALLSLDGVGAAVSLAELPANIVLETKGAVLAAISAANTTGATIAGAIDNAKLSIDQSYVDAADALRDLGVQTQKANIGTGNPSGLGSNINALSPHASAHPGNTPFNDPTSSFGLFSAINPGLLNLPISTQVKITKERQRVRAFTRPDFATMRDTLLDAATTFADQVGAGASTFDSTYGKPVVVTSRTPTDQDFEVMFQLNSVIIELNRFAAFGLDQTPPNPLDYVAGLAQASGMAFQLPASKFQVPFPYGTTLEQLAARYLGDPDRWIEIAALNGLREPYVDEVGFQVPLLTNGSGNTITVASNLNLYVNQLVVMSSNNTTRSSRHILSITSVGGSYYLITLDGTPDLSRFTTLGAAYMQAFLPDTVNSQMQLYIPSATQPTENQYNTTGIPGIDTFAPYFNIGGVDLLLTSDNDLVQTPDGDNRYAVGLTAIVQTARLALSTPLGSLFRHKNYGLAIKPGTSIADMSAQDLLTSTRDLFRDDPTFSGVNSAAINVSGPVVSIAIGAGLNGVSQVIPLIVDVQ